MTKLYIWCDGDPGVGIDGQQATLEIWLPKNEEEYKRFVYRCLTQCFQGIWNEKNIHIMTDEEIKDD